MLMCCVVNIQEHRRLQTADSTEHSQFLVAISTADCNVIMRYTFRDTQKPYCVLCVITALH